MIEASVISRSLQKCHTLLALFTQDGAAKNIYPLNLKPGTYNHRVWKLCGVERVQNMMPKAQEIPTNTVYQYIKKDMHANIKHADQV